MAAHSGVRSASRIIPSRDSSSAKTSLLRINSDSSTPIPHTWLASRISITSSITARYTGLDALPTT